MNTSTSSSTTPTMDSTSPTVKNTSVTTGSMSPTMDSTSETAATSPAAISSSRTADSTSPATKSTTPTASSTSPSTVAAKLVTDSTSPTMNRSSLIGAHDQAMALEEQRGLDSTNTARPAPSTQGDSSTIPLSARVSPADAKFGFMWKCCDCKMYLYSGEGLISPCGHHACPSCQTYSFMDRFSRADAAW